MVSYANKKVLVLGAGISGKGVARVLASLGAKVVLNDKAEINLEESKVQELLAMGVVVVGGSQESELLEGVDRVVLSPGIPPHIPIIAEAKKRSIPVVGEVEIAYELSKAPILGVTGTNGKTTTTMLLGAVIKEANIPCEVGGNIGDALSEAAIQTDPNGYLVAELSSYQLETVDQLRTKGAILLNLSPDHLARHKTMEAYGKAKTSIFRRQEASDFAVINSDDERIHAMAAETHGKVLFFSTRRAVRDGAFSDKHTLYAVKAGEAVAVVNRNELHLRGEHNVQNALAVIALTYALGISIETIGAAIRKFEPVEHRMEPVRTLDGVTYINDSKATNSDSVFSALASYDEPIVLMLGGYDKGEDMTPLMKLVSERIKHVVFMGAAGERFKEAGIEAGVASYSMASSMKEAIDKARKAATIGDLVLLSPATSSFDWYHSFEERGEDFKKLVLELV